VILGTLEAMVVSSFLVFCRVGACLMVMPGFSSSRVPVQVRLFLVVSVSLAIAPLVADSPQLKLVGRSVSSLVLAIAAECILGLSIGFIGRAFFEALQFSATAIASYIGIGGISGLPVEGNEPSPALASFVMATATLLFFLADQHLDVIRALAGSYHVVPLGQVVDSLVTLERVLKAISNAFVLALQVSGPFIIYTLAVNLLFGLANKMTPQIPVFFISLPFVIAGGLFLLFWTLPEALPVFRSGFVFFFERS
jgi:flagellar biosynthesis protein FliR